MKLREFSLRGVGLALCLMGAVVVANTMVFANTVAFASDEEQNAAGDKPSPGQDAVFVVEVVSDEPQKPVSPKPVQAEEDLKQRRQDLVVGLDAAIEQADQENHGKYWIGLMCNPPGEALRVQLDLPADVGLLVEEVTDGSPAMKAGIQKHDLLLSVTNADKSGAGPTQLKGISDLIGQIRQAERSPLKIEFLRRGRRQTLEVVPEERPKRPTHPIPVGVQADDYQVVRLFTEGAPGAIAMRWAGPLVVQSLPRLPEGVTIDYQAAAGQPEKLTVKRGNDSWMVSPNELDKLPEDLRAVAGQYLTARRASAAQGFVAHAGTGAGPYFYVHGRATVIPDDVTVTVVRHGSEPAKINVKKGDQSWDVTEQEMVKLPEELRPYAEWTLTGHTSHPRHLSARVVPHPMPPAAVDVRSLPSSPAAPGAVVPQPVKPGDQWTRMTRSATDAHQKDIERRLKELTEQVEKLRQAVEKSQSKQ